MTTRLITRPVGLAVTLADAKLTLRIEDDLTEFDALLTRWIRGVTREAEHNLGRALITQQWRVSLDEVADAIRLEHPPITSVDSVKFYDADNVLQTLDPQDYTADLVSEPGYIVPAPGRAWPQLYARPHAIMVDYTCGYGPDESTVPEDVQLYILARLSEQWDPATRAFTETAQSKYVVALLDACRVYA